MARLPRTCCHNKRIGGTGTTLLPEEEHHSDGLAGTAYTIITVTETQTRYPKECKLNTMNNDRSAPAAMTS